MEKPILIRYISGEATEEEKSKVVDWIDASPENMREFLALRKLHDMTVWQNFRERNQVWGRWRIFSNRKVEKILIEGIKFAAVFLLGLLVYSLWQKEPSLPPVVMQTINVPAGQRAEITLADGSHVWLNANSRLRFPNLFIDDKREVFLDGEGYFSVTSLPGQPFTVHTGDYNVRALGTEFNVLAYSDKNIFEVSLLSGSVEVMKTGFPVRVRGLGTINNNDPLFVVNNVPVTTGLQEINPEDIESITVLKDAASAAIYGTRGANGVIINKGSLM